MGLSDGAFFMIKHTPLPNRNHPILSPICQMGVADTLGLYCLNIFVKCGTVYILLNEVTFVKKRILPVNQAPKHFPEVHSVAV